MCESSQPILGDVKLPTGIEDVDKTLVAACPATWSTLAIGPLDCGTTISTLEMLVGRSQRWGKPGTRPIY
jgi:hypothetical protein